MNNRHKALGIEDSIRLEVFKNMLPNIVEQEKILLSAFKVEFIGGQVRICFAVDPGVEIENILSRNGFHEDMYDMTRLEIKKVKPDGDYITMLCRVYSRNLK